MIVSGRITIDRIASYSSCLIALLLILCLSFAQAQAAPENVPKPVAKSASAPTPTSAPQAPPIFQSTDRVLAYYGPAVRAKLKALFAAQNIAYPPRAMTWIALKEEKQLMLFAKNKTGAYKQVLSYPIIGTSGVAGPKLKEGDKQVPEGFYKIAGFRPNLVAHIGMDVSYPNAADKAHAQAEKRRNLGCDILIHGSKWSTGCLAMGNEPIEEIFVLAEDVGAKNISLIFAPCNLVHTAPAVDFKKQPVWLRDLYRELRVEMARYPI
ncbi:L,D-transpeptidase family protein [bacterium]|nr:L,D-transpeptidase family protein [bacterium]MBP9808557.1 L,D-transpeptidase family protein [bacterium]